jgi:TRAP-type C4-dicarboxylate transport system permease small subunit
MTRLAAIGAFLRARAQNIAVAMLAVMFVAFIIQIVMRYFFRMPVGWTFELTLILWLWLVLWGAAFITTEREEIRFEIVRNAVGRRTRRVMAGLAVIGLLVLYGISLPAVVDYVSFMKVQSTVYFRIRFDALFSIYVIFAVAVLVRYAWLLWRLVRGHDPLEDEAMTFDEPIIGEPGLSEGPRP